MDTAPVSVPRPSVDPPVPPRYWWLKRLSIAAVALLLILGTVRWWWGVYAARALEAEIAAIRARGEPLFPRDFGKPPIPDEQNAAVLLKKAAATLRLTSSQAATLRKIVSGSALLPENRDAAAELLALTADQRALVREARGLDQADWRFQWDLHTPAPNFQPYDHMTGTLILASLVAHADSDDLEAMASLLDAIAVGRHLQTFGPLLTCLIGVGSAEITAQAIERIGRDLDLSSERQRAAAHMLISRLLDDGTFRAGLVLAKQAGRGVAANAIELATAPGGVDLISAKQLSGPARAWKHALRPMYQLDAVRLLRFWNAQVMAAAASDWPEARTRLPPKPSSVSGLKMSSRLLSILVPSLPTLAGAFESIARMRMAATALAIWLYKHDHGAMPPDLEALVPEYLSAVPLDPCTENRPIEYGRLNGAAYLLSVGCRETGGSVTPVRFWLDKRPVTTRRATTPSD